MIWLQNNDKHDDLAEFNPDSGDFQIHSRALLSNHAPSRTAGFFATLSGVFFALYRYRGELLLRVSEMAIPLSADVVIDVSGPATCRVISVIKANHEILRLEYNLDSSQQFPNDPTPFIEAEDFDFGLFISKVSKMSRERKDAFLAGGTDDFAE